MNACRETRREKWITATVNGLPTSQLAHVQHGITFISLLLFLGAFAFIAIIAMKIVPIYLLNMNVVNSIEAITKEPNAAALPAQQIQQLINKRFDINGIENVPIYINGVQKPLRASEVKIRPQGSAKILELNYEDRRPLFYNLSIVANFNIIVTLKP